MPVSIKGGLEGMFTIGHDNSRYLFTGLYEERYMIADNPDLVWFAGVGLHVGYRKIGIPAYIDILKDRLVEPVIIPATTEKHLIGGADAIIGITFRFPGIPIIIGLDMKPNTDFINAGSMMVDGGIRAGLSF